MNKKIITIGALIIISAIVWGAVIIGCSLALKGTGCYNEIQNILAGGVTVHLILIWSPMMLLFKKKKDISSENWKYGSPAYNKVYMKRSLHGSQLRNAMVTVWNAVTAFEIQ